VVGQGRSTLFLILVAVFFPVEDTLSISLGGTNPEDRDIGRRGVQVFVSLLLS
jgi:hypothetical protein